MPAGSPKGWPRSPRHVGWCATPVEQGTGPGGVPGPGPLATTGVEPVCRPRPTATILRSKAPTVRDDDHLRPRSSGVPRRAGRARRGTPDERGRRWSSSRTVGALDRRVVAVGRGRQTGSTPVVARGPGPGTPPGPVPCSSGVAHHPTCLGDRGQPFGEPAGMALLRPGQCLEPLGDLVEALVTGRPGEPRVHLRVLVRLALDGGLQIVLGRADRGAGDRVAYLAEEVEVAERMSGLPLGDGPEERGHVGVALDVRLLREVEVAAIGLALAGERLLQVFLGLAVLQCWHGVPLLALAVVEASTNRRW